jgi:hypothetical protein
MTRLPLLLAAALAVPALASAQPIPGPAERGGDRRELRQDRRELRDDRGDAGRLEALLARLDAARARRDRRQLAAIDDAVLRELAADRAETRVEVARDAREVRDARREVRADDRDGRWGDADDRHDFRDDRRDLEAERRIAHRRAEIDRDLRALRGRYGPPALERRRALVVELVGLARGELSGDVRELREDRRELREDRRR